MPPFILCEHLSFAFHGPDGTEQPVLRDLSLEIESGELVTILGANGSGKTTFIRHLNGLLEPSSGRLLVGGLDPRQADARRLLHQQVGMVFQQPEDQVVAATVEDDVAFGPENVGLPPAEIRRRVEEALRATGLWEERQRPPHMLSAGQVQRLALAGVLALRPRCVVFDEATAMLDPAGRRMALEAMQELHRQGLTILYITHHMEEAVLAQRALVLDHGRLAFDGSPRRLFSDAAALESLRLELPPAAALAARLRRTFPALVQDIMTGEELRVGIGGIHPQIHPHTPLRGCYATRPLSLGGRGEENLPLLPEREKGVGGMRVDSQQPLISVSNLSHIYLRDTPLAHTALTSVDLVMQKGRPFGLMGRTGSGKSTLLQHLNGLLRPQSGEVQVGPFTLNDPAVLTRTVIQMVGLVFQNPETQFFETFAGDEIAYGPRQLELPGSLADRVRAAMELVGLNFEQFKDRRLFTLSGGEARKVALASVLALQPSILLLDEPTAGLDPSSRVEILQHIRQLQAGGMEVVVSSHRMEDLAELTADLALFEGGRVALSGPQAQVFAQAEALQAAGLEQPLAVQAATWLREAGLALPDGITTPDALAQAVADGYAADGGVDEPV